MNVESSSPERKNNRHIIWGFVGLLCGVVLGILITLNRSSAENLESCTMEHDDNGDGKSDAFYHYERGVIVRAEHDRNFDGKPDYWVWYRDGIESRGEIDDDFDGKIDGWYTCMFGNKWFSKHDVDKNGVPDVFQHFEHDIVKIAVWRPNETRNPTRIDFYEKAVKVRELRDTSDDGLLDTMVTFDAFENQVSVEKLSELLKAEDVVRSVLQSR